MAGPYGSKWQKARAKYLTEHPLCVMCETEGRVTQGSVVDHRQPHRLKEAKTEAERRAALKLFWDRKNWQTLCKRHHDSDKQRLEKSGTVLGCDDTGLPLDPNHHWHRARQG